MSVSQIEPQIKYEIATLAYYASSVLNIVCIDYISHDLLFCKSDMIGILHNTFACVSTRRFGILVIATLATKSIQLLHLQFHFRHQSSIYIRFFYNRRKYICAPEWLSLEAAK